MASIFNKTFDPDVQAELRYRKQLQNIQIPLIPHLRVTSLIQGQLEQGGGQLRGLTLGPTNTDLYDLFGTQVNELGIQTAIGTTYSTNGQPRPVTIPSTKRNLPMPGVESFNLDVQADGRTFKANLLMRCYGLEQYNFLYQTFTRPGTPILVEFGHTRGDLENNRATDVTANGLVDLTNLGDYESGNDIVLGFFDDLSDERVGVYERMLNGFRSPISTRTGGAIAGMVTNFDVKLNANNEYEISLELINSLEWFYNLQNNDTFISYGEIRGLSKSIKANFGFGTYEDGDYRPDTDRIFHLVLRELFPKKNIKEIPDPRAKAFLFTARTDYLFALREEQSSEISEEANRRTIIRKAMETDDDVYVSLDFFLNNLLNKIVTFSYNDLLQLYESLKPSEFYVFDRRIASRRAIREGAEEAFDPQDLETEEGRAAPVTDIRTILSPESYCTYWRNLRSIDSDVIFNNKLLYITDDAGYRAGQEIVAADVYYKERWRDYAEKFNIKTDASSRDKSLNRLFVIDPYLSGENVQVYGEDELVGSDVEDGKRINNFKGIFIKYRKIRKAFMQSDTLAESIVKILDLVNKASNGVLNLKMTFAEANYKIDEVTDNALDYNKFELIIYDESSLPGIRENENVYTFFQDNVSEAISYDLDFNLPSAVSSVIVANEFGTNYSAGGDLRNKMFVDYGYDPGISKLINRPQVDSPPQGSSANADVTNEYAIEDFEGFRELEGELRERTGTNGLFGYLDLNPPAMKERLVRSGLNNTLPSAARITITLQGIAGVKWGDLFRVENILPEPYNSNSLFMVIGYKHVVDEVEWRTTITGQLIASNPQGENPDFGLAADNLVTLNERSSEEKLRDAERLRRPWDRNTDGIPLRQSALVQLDPRWTYIILRARAQMEREGKTFGIISAYRTELENLEARGARNSRHLEGRAIDVRIYDFENGQAVGEGLRRDDPSALPAFRDLATLFQSIGETLNPPAYVRWGGNFNDPNHYDIR